MAERKGIDEQRFERLTSREQQRVLDHMHASTTGAWGLSLDQLRIILSGYFEGMACSSANRCSACKLGWTNPTRRAGKSARRRKSFSPTSPES